MRRVFLCLVAILIISAQVAFSGVIPDLIWYQASLADAGGKAVDGAYNMTFSLWDSPTGGQKKWEETLNSVPVAKGLFSVILGSQNPVKAENFIAGQVYLQIKIAGETLTPRQRVASVPYAHVAEAVSGSSNILPSGGKSGIGTLEPSAKLDVRGAIGLSGYADLPDQTAYNLYMAGNYNSTDIGKIYVGDNSGWKFHFASRTEGNDVNLMTIRDNGRVGIGISDPTELLQVAGTIHATAGGFKFPDGTVQSTAATGGGSGQADNLGNHIATQNIRLNGHWLSGDGGNEGVSITGNGFVGIGDNSPTNQLDVAGTIGINDTQVMFLPDQTNFKGTIYFGDGGGNLVHTDENSGRYNTAAGEGIGFLYQSSYTGIIFIFVKFFTSAHERDDTLKRHFAFLRYS
ncbi:hypothetical protein JW935_03830 [candidate division KSB1 bacterium]|nr:hypothetical protein [candidate division KSB1 bacterium]